MVIGRVEELPWLKWKFSWSMKAREEKERKKHCALGPLVNGPDDWMGAWQLNRGWEQLGVAYVRSRASGDDEYDVAAGTFIGRVLYCTVEFEIDVLIRCCVPRAPIGAFLKIHSDECWLALELLVLGSMAEESGEARNTGVSRRQQARVLPRRSVREGDRKAQERSRQEGTPF